MEYRPHEYQKYCTQFILDHPCAYICIQCGMGKTSLTLSAIDQLMNDCFEVSRVLVVAPLRVAKLSWPDEINKFDCFRHLSYSVVVGTAAQRKAALDTKADIYIINRENLQWLVSCLGPAFDFDMVVLDEISSFKNWSSKRFRAFMKVRPKVKRFFSDGSIILVSARGQSFLRTVLLRKKLKISWLQLLFVSGSDLHPLT